MIYALNVTRFIFEHYISSNSNVVTAAASGVIVGVVKAKYSKIKISWYLNFQNCIVLDSYHMASNNKVCSKCLKSRSVIARTKFGLWILRVCAVTSVVSNFVTSWAVSHQASLSMEFSWQEYWSGFPCSSAGIFLTQGSNPLLFHSEL